MPLEWIPYGVAAYALGSIPFGQIIARAVARIDITAHGSGNIGATNVARELGIRWGLVTLLLDAFKAVVPMALFLQVSNPAGAHREAALCLVGLLALVGHQFSVFRRFRGGKGVATALGMYLVLSPPATLAAVCVFVVSVWIWDFVSLGSLLAALTMPVALGILGRPVFVVAGAVVAAALIGLKHAGNIGRLFRGEERRWRQRAQDRRSSSLSNSSSE